MPTAIVGAIAVGFGVTVAVAQVIFTIGMFAIQTMMANRAAKKAAGAAGRAARAEIDAYNGRLVDRTQVIRSGVQPRNIILGRDEVSGPLACWFTYGPLRNFHAFAVVLAGHECDAVERVMFNHEPVTLNGAGQVVAPAKYVRTVSRSPSVSFAGGVAGTVYTLPEVPTRINSVTSGQESIAYTRSGANITINADAWWSIDDRPNGWLPVFINYTVIADQPLFTVKTYLGAPGQAAAPEMIAAAAAAGVPASWDASRKGTGICYLSVVVDADFNVLGQIGIPNVSGIVRGVKAYDARTSLTAWTQNPAVLSRWFMVDSGFAPKTLSGEVHAGELLASANVSDEPLAFSGARTEARYTCNGQLTSAASPDNNLRHILDAMDGDAVWVSGQWQVVAGYYKEPTLHLDEDTLSSAGISIAPYTRKSDLFNAVRGTYVNAAAGYTRTGYQLVTSAVYQAEDGGELLPAEVSFELVNDAVRCQMIAWQRLTRARQPLTLQLGTTLKGYDSAPLQNLTVSLRRPGYVNKVFANLRREFEAGTLLYILQETGPEVWAWDYTRASAAVNIPNTSYPDVVTVPTVTGISLASGTEALQKLGDGTIISRVRIRWDLVQNTYVTNGGKIEWQHKKATDTSDDWVALPAARGEDVEIFTATLADGDVMLFRGRAVTGSGRKGDWCPVVYTTVVGKSEAPPDVLGFAVDFDGYASWPDLSGVADLAGYKIRWQPGNNRSWGDATPLHDGLLLASPYPISIRPTVVATYMIKAIDTSGNESALPAVSVINLGNPVVANIVTEYDFKAAGWPGVYTGATVVGGNLVATADASSLGWDANPATAGWTYDTDPGWTLDTYGPVAYESDIFVVVDTDEGAQLTLPNTIAGAAYLIEMRRDGDAPGWTTDAEPGWTADADPGWDAGVSWAPWPGAVRAKAGRYQWRASIQSRDVQGVVSAFAASLDVVDQFESVGRLPVLAAGTVVPTSKTWRAITSIGLTLVADGGSAVSLRIEAPEADRIITARNAANVAVDGTALVNLQGY